MRKFKLILLILIGMIFFSCQKISILHSDENIHELFTEREIKEIVKMISYVDDMVLKTTNNEDINLAYHQFLEKIDLTIQDSSKFLEPFKDEEKYQFLESLDSTIFNSFWHMSHQMRMIRYKDTVYHNLDNYKRLNLNPTGRYLDYLAKVGEDDKYYKTLKEGIEIAGDLTTGKAFWFLKNHKIFDFNIPKHRLWVAVYILSIEEHYEKKMGRWLDQRNSMHNMR